MKNLSLLLILTALTFTLQAQEVKEYGPSSGSFAVGIAANPAFEYLGNFFGKTVNNSAPTANLANGYHLFGKYFSSPKTAFRAGISFGYDTETTFFGIEDENKLKKIYIVNEDRLSMVLRLVSVFLQPVIRINMLKIQLLEISLNKPTGHP